MEVYRITTLKWANSLTASGRAARWNSHRRYVIYTAASRALACLENVVHRSGEGYDHLFRTMRIDIPDSLAIDRVTMDQLPEDWSSVANYRLLQTLGNSWLDAGTTAVLRVPSAIIHYEFNYLLNPQHSDFSQIKLIGTEPFRFDQRL